MLTASWNTLAGLCAFVWVCVCACLCLKASLHKFARMCFCVCVCVHECRRFLCEYASVCTTPGYPHACIPVCNNSPVLHITTTHRLLHYYYIISAFVLPCAFMRPFNYNSVCLMSILMLAVTINYWQAVSVCLWGRFINPLLLSVCVLCCLVHDECVIQYTLCHQQTVSVIIVRGFFWLLGKNI